MEDNQNKEAMFKNILNSYYRSGSDLYKNIKHLSTNTFEKATAVHISFNNQYFDIIIWYGTEYIVFEVTQQILLDSWLLKYLKERDIPIYLNKCMWQLKSIQRFISLDINIDIYNSYNAYTFALTSRTIGKVSIYMNILENFAKKGLIDSQHVNFIGVKSEHFVNYLEQIINILSEYDVPFTKNLIILYIRRKIEIPHIHKYGYDMNDPEFIEEYKRNRFYPPSYNIDMSHINK